MNLHTKNRCHGWNRLRSKNPGGFGRTDWLTDGWTGGHVSKFSPCGYPMNMHTKNRFPRWNRSWSKNPGGFGWMDWRTDGLTRLIMWVIFHIYSWSWTCITKMVVLGSFLHGQKLRTGKVEKIILKRTHFCMSFFWTWWSECKWSDPYPTHLNVHTDTVITLQAMIMPACNNTKTMNSNHTKKVAYVWWHIPFGIKYIQVQKFYTILYKTCFRSKSCFMKEWMAKKKKKIG